MAQTADIGQTRACEGRATRSYRPRLTYERRPDAAITRLAYRVSKHRHQIEND